MLQKALEEAGVRFTPGRRQNCNLTCNLDTDF